MRKVMTIGAVAASLVSGSLGIAHAQDAACGCVVKAAQSAALGTIQASEGRVVILSAAGPRRGAAGQSIMAADRVATSVKSSAVVSAGGCQVALAGEQELRFERQGENLCVAVNNTAGVMTTGQVAGAPAATSSTAPAWVLPVLGAAAVIGGVAIIASTNDSDDRVSR
jgi:hypothetical protein